LIISNKSDKIFAWNKDDFGQNKDKYFKGYLTLMIGLKKMGGVVVDTIY